MHAFLDVSPRRVGHSEKLNGNWGKPLTLSPCCTFTTADVPSYLLLIRDKDLLGLFDHGLGLQVLLSANLCFRVEELPAGHAGQDQVGRVRIEVHIYLTQLGSMGLGVSSPFPGRILKDREAGGLKKPRLTEQPKAHVTYPDTYLTLKVTEATAAWKEEIL